MVPAARAAGVGSPRKIGCALPDLFHIVDDGFEAADTAGTDVVWRHPLPDGRDAVVAGARLRLGPRDHADGEDYVYRTPMGAVLSAARWMEAGCRDEPDGWSRHVASGRVRPDATPGETERAWVCPRHPNRLPGFERGHLWCAVCRAAVTDAIRVAWPPARTR